MGFRTILITGATGKFGRALTSNFLAAGDRVVAVCRTEESLQKLVSEYSDADKHLTAIKADLTDTAATSLILSELESNSLRPDCLVNSARNIASLEIEDNGLVSRKNFSDEYLLDVIVPYELTMALSMQKNSQLQRVVNIGSMYGMVAANPQLYTDLDKQSPVHYGVAKAGLAHLTKELAVRLAGKGIQVNCVAYGGVEGRVDEAFKQRYAQLCPMGRMLTKDEIVGPVDMLLSDKCSGVTGQTLPVDGGWGIW